MAKKFSIRFDTDKNGKPVAYKMGRERQYRMNYDTAKMLESIGYRTYYGPNFNKPGRFQFTEVSQNKVIITQVG